MKFSPKQLCLALALLALAGCHKKKPEQMALYGGNQLEDIFTVKSVDAGSATLEGTPKDLKAGDPLYFARPPYQFKVTAVNGNQVTIALAGKQDLEVDNKLFRNENQQVKSAIDQDKKLKDAVSE